MRKLKAIWGILTSRCWFVAFSKTGHINSTLTVDGIYTYAAGETIVHYIVDRMAEVEAQEGAVDEVKNIINGTL